MNMSEVARLRWQIEREVEAMMLVKSGLAQGIARHDFINARLDRIGVCQEQLSAQVGTQEAITIVCTLYAQAMESA